MSFFRLDNNWLPIRLNTKWPMAQLFKGRHRNSNMEFLNIAQIFEHCPNFFEHRSKDLWFKGALPVPCALPLQFRPKKIFFFQPFFVFSLLLPFLMLKNAFKKHPLQNRTNVQIKGGGVKGLLNNVQKNCTFLKGRLPLWLNRRSAPASYIELSTGLGDYFILDCNGSYTERWLKRTI